MRPHNISHSQINWFTGSALRILKLCNLHLEIKFLLNLWSVSQAQWDKDHTSVPRHPRSHPFYALHLLPLSTDFQLLASWTLLEDHCYASSTAQSEDNGKMKMGPKYQKWRDEELHSREAYSHHERVSVLKRAPIKWTEKHSDQKRRGGKKLFPQGFYIFIWWMSHNLYNLLSHQITLLRHQLLASLYFPVVSVDVVVAAAAAFVTWPGLVISSNPSSLVLNQLAPNEKHAFS